MTVEVATNTRARAQTQSWQIGRQRSSSSCEYTPEILWWLWNYGKYARYLSPSCATASNRQLNSFNFTVKIVRRFCLCSWVWLVSRFASAKSKQRPIECNSSNNNNFVHSRRGMWHAIGLHALEIKEKEETETVSLLLTNRIHLGIPSKEKELELVSRLWEPIHHRPAKSWPRASDGRITFHISASGLWSTQYLARNIISFWSFDREIISFIVCWWCRRSAERISIKTNEQQTD